MHRRSKIVTVRLSEQEMELCDHLALRKGIDRSSVFRQSMLELAAREGLPLPTKEAAGPEDKG